MLTRANWGLWGPTGNISDIDPLPKNKAASSCRKLSSDADPPPLQSQFAHKAVNSLRGKKCA